MAITSVLPRSVASVATTALLAGLLTGPATPTVAATGAHSGGGR